MRINPTMIIRGMKSTHPGDIVKQLMRKENLSTYALAKEAKTTQATIHRLVNKEVTDPSITLLIKVADFFGITLDQLLGRSPLPGTKGRIMAVNERKYMVPLAGTVENGPKKEFMLEGYPRDYGDKYLAYHGNYKDSYCLTFATKKYFLIGAVGDAIILAPKELPTLRDRVLVQTNGEYRLLHYVAENEESIIFQALDNAQPFAIEKLSIKLCHTVKSLVFNPNFISKET